MSREFTKVGVIGLGTMGVGIVEVFARNGIDVVAMEVDDAAVERGKGVLAKSTGRALDLGWQTGRAAAGGPEYACSGDVTAHVAFDAAGRWAGFSARGEDGHDIVYEPA